MGLRSCYEALESRLDRGEFYWLRDSSDEVNGILEEAAICPLVLTDCKLEWLQDRILLCGRGKPFSFSDALFLVTISIGEGNGSFLWEASLESVKEEVTLGEMFPFLPDSYVTEDSVLKKKKSVLAGLKLYNWTFKGDSRRDAADRYELQGRICFSGAEVWDRYYKGFLPETAPFTGTLEMLPAGSSRFVLHAELFQDIRIPLQEYVEEKGFAGSLEAVLYSHVERDMEELSSAGLVWRITLPGVSTPAVFSLPLFEENDIWALKAAFPSGLAASDLVNFIGSVLALKKGDDRLLLPDGLPVLDFFRLYGLEFDLAREKNPLNSRIMSVGILLSNKESYTPSVPLFTLRRLSLYLQASFSAYMKKHLGRDVLLSGYLTGMVEFCLSDRLNLLLKMKAEFPDYSIHAGLYITEKEPEIPYSYNEILEAFGAGVDKNLALASLEVFADVRQRAFELDLEIRDVWEIELSGFSLGIEGITSVIFCSASTWEIELEGRFFVGLQGDGAAKGMNKAVFQVKASYNKYWRFEGGLLKGELSIADVVSRLFFGEVIEDPLFDIRLTEFWISFALDEMRTFSLKAAMESAWNVPLLGRQIQLRGEVSFLRDTRLHLSVAGQIALGVFKLRVEAAEAASENPVFRFRIQYREAFLEARYEKQEVSGRIHEILTVSLGNLTLGDILVYIGNLINPYGDFSLSGPWKILEKISLSNLALSVDFTDKKVYFLYKVKLSVPGLMKIDEIGISYDAKQSSESLKIIITGNFLEKQYTVSNPLSWDLQEEEPPRADGEDKENFKVSYMGLGVHTACGDIQQKTSVLEALSELKKQLVPIDGSLPEVRYDSSNHWLFGVEALLGGGLYAGLVLNDPALYGIHLEIKKSSDGSFLDSFAGLMLELLYRKVTKDIGMFRAELVMPEKFRHFDLGCFSITLGRMSLEIYTNGNFQLDLGFPHNRDFSSSFVVEAGIYTGKGGLYFGVLNGDTSRQVPEITNGAFHSVLSFGVGLSIGFGRSFDMGIVKGNVYLGITGIFEGVFAVFRPQDPAKPDAMYYKVQATAGIAGSLNLTVDLKLIAISASVELEAFAMLTIESCQPLLVALDFALELKAYIKILFIKIRFKMSFSYHASFEMGKASAAPWILQKEEEPARKNVRGKRSRLCCAVREEPRNIFSVHSLCNDKEPVEIFVRIRPSVTVDLADGGQDCLLLLPYLALGESAASGFGDFLGAAADWLLTRLGEEAYIAVQETEQWEEGWPRHISYPFIEGFLENYVKLTVQILPYEEKEEEGVVFPMLPELKLSLSGKKGEEEVFGAHVDYREDTMVPPGYVQEVQEYFKKLMMLEEKTPDVKAGQEKSLQEYFAEEYMSCLFGMLLDFFKGCFRTLAFDMGQLTLAETAELFYDGAGAEVKIIRSNKEKKLRAGCRLTFRELTLMNENTDLKGMAERLGVSFSGLLFDIGDNVHLLQPGFLLFVPEQEAVNPGGLPYRLLAAFYFVRLFDEKIRDGYGEAAAVLTSENEFPYGWEETQEEGRIIELHGIGEYRTAPGDTVARLAKMLTLYHGSDTLYPEWNEFREYVEKYGKLKECSIEVWEAAAPGALLRRLLPFSGPPDLEHWICRAAILRRYALFTLSEWETDCGGMTAAELCGKYGIKMEQAAEALSGQRGFFEDTVVTLEDIRYLPKDIAAQKVKAKEEVSSVGAGISRFYLQGLRLPVPGAANGENAAIYRLLRQELPLQDNFDTLDFQAEANPEAGWIRVQESSGRLSMQQVFACRPLGTLALSWAERPVQSPFYRSVWKHYNPAESFTVYKGEGGAFGLHLLSGDFLADAAAAAEDEREYAAFDDKGEGLAFSFGCFVKLKIRKNPREDCGYYLLGADSKSRDLLYQAWRGFCGRSLLFYRASMTGDVEAGCCQDTYKKEQVRLIRQNLSRETKSGFSLNLARDAGQEEYRNTADLGERNFVRLLWECSVVQGDYRMYYENTGHSGFPDSIFDENGMGEVFFLAVSDETDKKAGYLPGCNCVVTDRLFTGDGLLYLRGSRPFAIHQRQQCLFEAGTAGIRYRLNRREEPGREEKEAFREWLTGALYHIGGYEITENEYFEGSGYSYPVLPAEDEERRFTYGIRLPLYRYAKEGDGGVYAGLGAKAEVMLDVRDIYGNVYGDGCSPVTVYNPYHDELYALGDIPYAVLGYDAAGTGEGVVLTFRMRPELASGLSGDTARVSQQAVLCRQIREQYRQQDVEFTLTHTMADVEGRPDKEKLLAYLERCAAFLEYYGRITDLTVSGGTLSEIARVYSADFGELAAYDGILGEMFAQPDRLTVPMTVRVCPKDTVEDLTREAELDVEKNQEAMLSAHTVLFMPQKVYVNEEEGASFAETAEALGIPLALFIDANKQKTGILREGSSFSHGEHRVSVQEGDSLETVTERMNEEFGDDLDVSELLLEGENDRALRQGAELAYSFLYSRDKDTLFWNATGLSGEEFLQYNRQVEGLFVSSQTLLLKKNISLEGYEEYSLYEIAAAFSLKQEFLLSLWKEEALAEGSSWRIGNRKSLPDTPGEEEPDAPYRIVPHRPGGYAPVDMEQEFWLYNKDIMGIIKEGVHLTGTGFDFITGGFDTLSSVTEKACAISGREEKSVRKELEGQHFLRESFCCLYRPKDFCCSVTIPGVYEPGRSIIPLKMEVTVRRTKYIEEAPLEVVRKNTAAEPAEGADGTLDEFVKTLEGLDGVHIAAADSAKRELYAVYFGRGGIESICVGGDGERIYAALAPLSLKLISRAGVSFALLDEDGEFSGETGERSYDQVDLENWAVSFLEDFDEVLESPAYNAAAAGSRSVVNRLIVCKELLIEGIAGQLHSVADGIERGRYAQVEKPLKDRLGKSLKEGYKTGVYILYGQRLQTDRRVRMGLLVQDESGECPVLKAEKIDSSKDQYVLGIFPGNPYQGQITPELSCKITELEYDIEEGEDGYERSKWLQFYRPFSFAEDEGFPDPAWYVDLGLRTPVPVPLRSYPARPQLLFHKASCFPDPENAEELHQWEYSFTYRHQTASQDTLVFTIEFNFAEYESGLFASALSKDLFDCLAQYTEVREGLMNVLRERKQADGAVGTFLSLAEDIAGAWQGQRKGRLAPERNGYAPDTVTVQLGFSFEEGTLKCHCPAGSWPEWMEAAYVDEAGEHRFVKEKQEEHIWFVLEDGCEVIPGSGIVIRLTCKGLDLCRYYSAHTRVQVHRNQDLPGGKAVNPVFVYHGEEEAYPGAVFAHCEWKDRYEIGTVPEKEPDAAARHAAELLYGTFPLFETEGIEVQMGVRYFYAPRENAVRIELPVTLIPRMPVTGSIREITREQIGQWLSRLDEAHPVSGFCFELQFTYHGKVLMELENIEIRMG